MTDQGKVREPGQVPEPEPAEPQVDDESEIRRAETYARGTLPVPPLGRTVSNLQREGRTIT